MQKRAITRCPGQSYKKCISSHPELASLSLRNAIDQHRTYVGILAELGIDLIELPPEDNMPDSCFVEDTVVIFNDIALITRPKYESRRMETESIAEVLSDHMSVVFTKSPATLEGGDVIHLEKSLISGSTERTNELGIATMQKELGCKVGVVEDKSIVHLKSYVTYLGEGCFLGIEKYQNQPVFDGYRYLVIPQSESYASNTLTVNSTVIIPKGYPHTKQLLTENGFDTITLDTKEFARCEGALTCLSIIF